MLLYESEQFLPLLFIYVTWNSCDKSNTVFFLEFFVLWNFLGSIHMIRVSHSGVSIGEAPPSVYPILLILSLCNGLPPIPTGHSPPICFSIFPTPPGWTPSITGLPLPAPYYGEGYQPPPRKLPPSLIKQPSPLDNENILTTP